MVKHVPITSLIVHMQGVYYSKTLYILSDGSFYTIGLLRPKCMRKESECVKFEVDMMLKEENIVCQFVNSSMLRFSNFVHFIFIVI